MGRIVGWSVFGHRVEYTFPGSTSAQLTVDGLVSGWPFQIGDRWYDVRFRAGGTGPIVELFDDLDRAMPPTAQHAPRSVAPDNARCSTDGHGEARAAIACGRCGSFVCVACSWPDGTHCNSCAQRLLDGVKGSGPEVLLYYLPALLLCFFSCPGIVLAPIAGTVAMLVGRRMTTTGMKIAAASGVYLCAFAVSGLLMYLFVRAAR